MAGVETVAVATAELIRPASKTVVVSKNFMPQSSRSKTPRTFVKRRYLRNTARTRRVRPRVTDGGRIDSARPAYPRCLAAKTVPRRPRCNFLCTIDEIVLDDTIGRQINTRRAPPASAAGARHALDQRRRHFHHDRQRLEDLQRRRDPRLAAFSRQHRDRQVGAIRLAMAFLRYVDFRPQRSRLSGLRHRHGTISAKAVSS